MIFAWEDYLVLSEALVSGRGTFSPEEACLRSAISRAYYSAFISARNFLRERREVFLRGSGEDHKLVRNCFQQSADRRRRQIGLWLGRLSATRGKADYEDVFVGRLVKSAEASLQEARYLLDSLRSLP